MSLHLEETDPVGRAASALARARRPVALTGAGVSTESGIPDFRSPGGLWSIFDPAEYATLSCFLREPEKAWRLYRALAASLVGRKPNPGHRALARLEAAGRLAGIVTQNIDGLHQEAGSRGVIELHGEARHLHCPACGRLEPARVAHLTPGPAPHCDDCGAFLKPNVVLFEEEVRDMEAVAELLSGCDLLLVIGTSAQVVPASDLPARVRALGGSILEFNLEPTELTASGLGRSGTFVPGRVGQTLPLVVERALSR
jgi:NAD-dependent deacetylase